MSKLSIVVPVYNVEKYLRKCIDSILNQTFKDFELILVDDGSLDNSGKICDEYKEKDDRIKVIHKKNGGLSDARNCGIDASKSEFISFIDSDDSIAPEMYEILYHNLMNASADVSTCGYYRCYQDKKVPNFQEQEDDVYVLTNEEAIKGILEDKRVSVEACCKIYRKSLFDEIRYPIGRLSEDAFTTPTVLSKANKIVGTTKPLLYYLMREDSITTSNFKKRDLDVIDAYQLNYELVHKHFPNLEKQGQFRVLWSYTYVLRKMLLSSELTDIEEYNRIVSYIRKNTVKIISNPYFSMQKKIAVICLLFSKSLYKKMIVAQAKKR